MPLISKEMKSFASYYYMMQYLYSRFYKYLYFASSFMTLK